MIIPYSKQWITSRDVKFVTSALKQKIITQGKYVENFESSVSKYVGSKYSLSVNSASSALLLCCHILGLKKGDIAWTVPITYAATANCILLTGASLDFVDIDINTFNISIKELEQKLSLAKKNKKLPKIIIPVHIAGEPCDMNKIYQLSKKYKFKIIEDASHAFGSKYNGLPVGSCAYSDLTVFSFHPVKTITTGEGGCITTNSKKYFTLGKALRSGGIVKDKKELIRRNLPKWYYEQHFLGYNFRMSDINAALGSSQLKRIKIFQKKREDIKKNYIKYLKILPVKFQQTSIDNKSSNHLFILILKNRRNELYQELRKSNIECNLNYIPLYKHPFYKKKFLKKFKNSEIYYRSALSIPIFPQLKKKEQRNIILKIKKFLLN